MKLLKRLRKAVRTSIPVLQSGIDDFYTTSGQFRARQRQPAAPDVLTDGKAAENAEHPLEMIAGRKTLRRDILLADIFQQVLLHVIDSSLQSGDPVHLIPPLSVCTLPQQGAAFPTSGAE